MSASTESLFEQTHSGGKERCMFLLSDLLLITSVKKRALKKSQQAANSAHDFLDNHKFKLLMKISLDDLETVKSELSFC